LGSTPITELNRPRDAVRALHERELEHMREQQTQALAQAQEEKVAELAAQDLIHQTRLQSLNEEHQAQLQAVRAEGQAHLISMRRRVAAAAHLALEDRQGSLRYLEDENERLRARVHELEQQLGLPVTVFPDRPRTPSLPPEMFISPSLPPPASTAAIEPSDSRENAPNTPACLHPAGHDDLTRLRGVGPAIARALVQLGITQFSQIAHWTDADIERIAPRLRTRPNRIRKDGWVKSAQGLQNKV
jgi:predicted flap endonuclease-1-like 5' DNA nuclease